MKNNAYISQIDDTLKEYVEELIKNNPDYFATDGANNRLVKQYFKDVYGIDVHNYIATKVHSITRMKSKFLENNPSYDRRVEESGKNTPQTTDRLYHEES